MQASEKFGIPEYGGDTSTRLNPAALHLSKDGGDRLRRQMPDPPFHSPMRVLFAFFVFLSASIAQDPFSYGKPAAEHVAVELVAERPAIAPGSTLTVGLSISHEQGWHSYFQHPGIGLPWTLDWDLPEGFSAGEIQWPVPEVIESFGLISYGYSGDVLLLVDLTAPDDLTTGDPVTLRATAKWQQCKETCEVGTKDLSLALEVATAVPADTNAAFAEARKQSALPSDTWSLSATVDEAGGAIDLVVTASDPSNATEISPGELYFFADSAGQVEDLTEQALAAGPAPGTYVLKLPHPEGAEPPGQLTGMLAKHSGWPEGQAAIPVSLTLGAQQAQVAPADETESPDDDTAGEATEDPYAITGDTQAKIDLIRSWGAVGLDGLEAEERGLWGMVFFALIGGIILNVMPCVFPVLGIKIMGFVSQAGSSKAHIRMHGLVYAAGVILSLWALVAVLLAVKAAIGTNVSWGFQLQNPAFLGFLITLMFVFGLSLSGAFEFGSSMTGVGGNLQAKSGYSGSFFTGLLTVLVATPCTGPFMAPAVSFALSGTTLDTFLVFTGLAVGVALPYVVLSFFPALVEKLPRPGPWMETFKQFMAFPLYATVIWLVVVFTKNVGAGGLAWLLGGLLTVAFGAWVFGRYGTPVKSRSTRWIARATAAITLVALAWSIQHSIATKPERRLAGDGESIERFGMEWVPFSLDRLIDYRAQGRTVFIDFTASW